MWWLNPVFVILFFVLPAFIFLGIYSGYALKLVFLHGVISILYFLMGCILAIPRRFKQCSIRVLQLDKVKLTLFILLFLSFLGYFTWFFDLILSPSLLVSSYLQAQGTFTLRGVVETTPGISTLTQFSVVYSALYSYVIFMDGRSPGRRYAIGFLVLFIFVFFRSLVWNERLAILEFLLPALVIFSIARARRRSRVVKYLPVLVAPAVFLLFSIFEFFRSWQSRSDSYEFWGYMLQRFISYYEKSITNGVDYLYWMDSPSYDGSAVFLFVYAIPGIGEFLKNNNDFSLGLGRFLTCCADPEFNQISWVFYIAADLGWALSAIFFLILGYGFQRAYLQFLNGKQFFIIYPVLVVSLFEFIRQPYLSSPRFFYIFIGSVLVCFFLKKPQIR